MPPSPSPQLSKELWQLDISLLAGLLPETELLDTAGFSATERRDIRRGDLEAVNQWLGVQGRLPLRTFLPIATRTALARFVAEVEAHDAEEELAIVNALLDRPVREVLPAIRVGFADAADQLDRWIRWRSELRATCTLVGEAALSPASADRGFQLAVRAGGWSAEKMESPAEIAVSIERTRGRVGQLRERVIRMIDRQCWLTPLREIAWRVLVRHGGLLGIDGWVRGLPRPARRGGPWQLRLFRDLSTNRIDPDSTWITVDGQDYAIAGQHLADDLIEQVRVAKAHLVAVAAGLAIRIPDTDGVPAGLPEQLIRHDPEWYPVGGGWYAARLNRRSAAVRGVQQMLGTYGPLQLDELRDGLARMIVERATRRRFDPPPVDLLGRLLAERGFEVSATGEVDLGARSAPAVGSIRKVQRLFLRTFRHGQWYCSADEILAVSRAKGMPDKEMLAFLDASPLVRNSPSGYHPVRQPKQFNQWHRKQPLPPPTIRWQ